MEQLHCFSYGLRMIDKRQKATKVKCKCEESLTNQSIFMEYSLLQKKHLSFAGAPWQMSTTLCQNRLEGTHNWTNLNLEPRDYWIYYVNIDFRHQYGISVAESQTLILAKCPQRRGERRNGCFRRLYISSLQILNLHICFHLCIYNIEYTTKFFQKVVNFTTLITNA